MVDAGSAAAFEQAFRALRSLGFREGEARAALTRVRNDVRLVNGTTEQLLRAALVAMTPDVAH
jgi:Holliday junction resolvasome RuvABC DNA-binding subunit